VGDIPKSYPPAIKGYGGAETKNPATWRGLMILSI